MKTYKTMNEAAEAVMKASGIEVSKPGAYADQMWGPSNAREYDPTMGKTHYIANPGMDCIVDAIYDNGHIWSVTGGWAVKGPGDKFTIAQMENSMSIWGYDASHRR